jgi:hypothetical protein
MKCRDIKKGIYLYKEISKREQEEIDLHLITCLSCRSAMDRVNAMRKVIAFQQAKVPPMTNEAMVTRRVMDVITRMQEKKNGRWIQFSQNPFDAFRYGMAALSVCLLVFFIDEYNIDRPGKIVKVHPRTFGKQVDLNLASFHGAFLTARENKKESSGLISECVAKCLRLQEPACQDCSEKFAKP